MKKEKHDSYDKLINQYEKRMAFFEMIILILVALLAITIVELFTKGGV